MNEKNQDYSEKSKQGILSMLSPKQSFILGIGGAAMVGIVIGFFILLGIVVNGESSNSVAGSTAPAPSAPSPTLTPPPPSRPPRPTNVVVQPVTAEDHVKGDRNAKISIIEFSDLECPFCKRIHPTLQKLVDDYNGQVNWVYRHFPLASLHPRAAYQAEATECANELGGNDGFWAYLDRLFEITPSNNGLQDSQLPQIAEDIGLNRSAFEACLNSGKYTSHVQSDLAQAQAAGGTGTPYSVIVADGQNIPVSGAVPISQFKAIIDPLL